MISLGALPRRQWAVCENCESALRILWRHFGKTTSCAFLTYFLFPEPSPAPAWLRKLVGDDLFSNVSIVTLDGANDETLVHLRKLTRLVWLDVSDTQVTDEGLQHLRGLIELQTLYLDDTEVTNAGLVHFKGMTNLESIGLSATQVTDGGLEHLRDLASLQSLFLFHTQVTKEGIEELQEALPNCKIHWTPPRPPTTNLDQN